jgi:putative phosphoesterase
MLTIGVISDTHGIARPEALEALRGVDRIIHAGDVGQPEVLDALRAIAPVTAVRGNVDRGELARLRVTRRVEVEGRSLYVIHDLSQLDLDARTAGLHAVVSGHTHRPVVQWEQDVLFLNPGSAGPRRFRLPVSLARITVTGGRLEPEIIHLPISS